MRLAVPTFLLIAGAGTQAATAQTIRVRVVEDGTKAVVAGAIVKILSTTGRALAQGLTNEAGLLSLRLTTRGPLQLRADRIGFEGVSIPIDVADNADTVRLEVTMPARPVLLPGIEVTTKSQCARAGRGGDGIDVLWNEIKKALEANQLTQDQGLVSLRAETFDRWLDADLRLIFDETTEIRQFAGPPFTTLEPEALAEGGFIRERANQVEFFGPDAALLLADSFVGTHCFTIVADRSRTPDQGQLGLRFAPVPGRTLPDIKGTLWVDRDHPRLRMIDFLFVNAPAHHAARWLGGMTRYGRLANGAWIVLDWSVRMPRFTVLTLDPGSAGQSIGQTLVGYREHGAKTDVAGNVPADLAIRGVVFDSLANAPLPGVVVTIVGDSTTTQTDLNGEFTLRPTKTGDLALEFAHPRLAFLPSPASRLVSSSLGGSAKIAVVIPGAERLRRWYCPTLREGTGTALGIVRLGPNGPAVSGTTVTATYEKLNTAFRFQSLTATTSAGGLFVMCQVPSRLPISIGVGEEDSLGHWQHISVPDRGIVTLELHP